MSGKIKRKSSRKGAGSWNHRGETQNQHSTSNSPNPIAGLSPRSGVASANLSKRQKMTSAVPILTRGLGVEFQQGQHTIEATILKTVTGIGYSVLTDSGERRLIPSDQIFILRR